MIFSTFDLCDIQMRDFMHFFREICKTTQKKIQYFQTIIAALSRYVFALKVVSLLIVRFLRKQLLTNENSHQHN